MCCVWVCVCTMGFWINDTLLDLYFGTARINKTYTVSHIWNIFPPDLSFEMWIITFFVFAHSYLQPILNTLESCFEMWFWMFFGPFFQQPSRSVKYLRFHCSCSSRDRLAEPEKKGKWREDETGRWEKKRWLCHLHLNRISHRHRQEESLQKQCWQLICSTVFESQKNLHLKKAEIQSRWCFAVSWM